MNPHLLAERITDTVERLRLRLEGRRIVVEAATGPYVVTPLLAAVAGAEVVALGKSTRYGTFDEIARQTSALADDLHVADRIRIVQSLADDDLAAADVVCNSGHLRPINAEMIGHMKPGTVIPLMYESWEFRPHDVDLAACRARGVLVAGTNERHPELGVFDYLGMLAVFGLHQLGIPAVHSRLLLVCGNPFAPYIARTLAACGAEVDVLGKAESRWGQGVHGRGADEPGYYDAVVLADTPGPRPNIGHRGAAVFCPEQLGEFAVLVQIWGDVDRRCLEGVECYPADAPEPGRMGILLSQLGSEPILCLQAGGLKVGQLLSDPQPDAAQIAEYCQPLVGALPSAAVT